MKELTQGSDVGIAEFSEWMGKTDSFRMKPDKLVRESILRDVDEGYSQCLTFAIMCSNPTQLMLFQCLQFPRYNPYNSYLIKAESLFLLPLSNEVLTMSSLALA
jgi:hypothetical protein